MWLYEYILGYYIFLKICIIKNTNVWTFFSVEMAQPDNSTVVSAFKSHLEREKMAGKNFNDWNRSLRISLRATDKLDYLNTPCPERPADTAPEAEKAA